MSKRSAPDELSDYDSDSDAPPDAFSSASAPALGAEDDPPEERKIGRSNKNRPSERSTRQRVSTFRVAPGLKGGKAENTIGRDPRFDTGGPSVDQDVWRNKYGFLYEQLQAEADEMKARLGESQRAKKRSQQRGGGAKRQRTRAKVLSADEEAAIRLELERTRNRLAADERKAKQQAVKAAVRKEEVAAVKQGKKPFFQKASTLKERELVIQYEELKKEGKLEKFLSKRRKKQEAKQKRVLPDGRPDGW